MAPNFAPGSCDPRAAYALGMVVKMMRTSSSEKRRACSNNSIAAMPLWQVQLDKLQRVLESPHVETHAKQGLVALIEDAESVDDVWTLLDRVDDDTSSSNSSNCLASAQASASPSSSVVSAQPSESLVESHASESMPVAFIPEELGCAICCCT